MIGAVVVLYNPKIEEIKNINTYLKNVDYVVAIDNSSDDNYQLVESVVFDKKKIQYYSEQKNLGLCKALNTGIDILRTKGYKWAILFDADSKIGSDIVSVYEKARQDYDEENVAIFTPVHLFDRSKNKMYMGYKSIDWSMTSGWCVNIEIFEKQRGFLEELFVDGLDMDYCFKTLENGYKVIECGEAIIYHHPAETREVLCFRYGIASPYRYYMQARQLIWCWRRYRRKSAILTYVYKWLKVIFLFPEKKNYMASMIKGTNEGRLMVKKYRGKLQNV